MKKTLEVIKPHERLLTINEFLDSYNTNMPPGYPRVSIALLEKFRDEHQSLFKSKEMWSLDHHRKKLIDWLPQNLN